MQTNPNKTKKVFALIALLGVLALPAVSSAFSSQAIAQEARDTQAKLQTMKTVAKKKPAVIATAPAPIHSQPKVAKKTTVTQRHDLPMCYF